MPQQITSVYQLPYPQLVDPANAPADFAALAQRMDTVLQNLEAGYVPIGAMMAWAAAAPPSRWLLCQGQTLLRAGTYAALFSVIQSAYNSGTVAADSFMLPDMQGRTLVGVDGAGPQNRLVANDTLGAASGEELHKLLTAEAAQKAVSTQGGSTVASATSAGSSGSGQTGDQSNSHAHGLAGAVPYAPGWSILNVATSANNRVANNNNWGGTTTSGTGSADQGHSHGFSVSVGNQPIPALTVNALSVSGSDANTPHNNMQPYQVVNFIIRYR
jgi:microcystin-dependent protein